MARRFAVEIAPAAFDALNAVRDRKSRGEIGKAIATLERNPGAQGKGLEGPLDGVRAIRADRDRYRILFEIDASARRVSVVFLGERRPGYTSDVYARAAALLRRLTR